MQGFNSEMGRRAVIVYAAVLHIMVYASLIRTITRH